MLEKLPNAIFCILGVCSSIGCGVEPHPTPRLSARALDIIAEESGLTDDLEPYIAMYTHVPDCMVDAECLHKCNLEASTLSAYIAARQGKGECSAIRMHRPFEARLGDGTTIRFTDIHPCIWEFASERAIGGTINIELPAKPPITLRVLRAGTVNSLVKILSGNSDAALAELRKSTAVADFVDAKKDVAPNAVRLNQFRTFAVLDLFGRHLELPRHKIQDCQLSEFERLVESEGMISDAYHMNLIRESVALMNAAYDKRMQPNRAAQEKLLARLLDLILNS